MKNKGIFNIILALMIAVTVLLFVYTVCFKSVVILEDPAFKVLYPEKAMSAFKKELVKNGFSIRVIEVEKDDIGVQENLEKIVEKYSKKDYMILSPVISSAIKYNKIDLPSCTIALGSDESEFFTTSLKTDVESLYSAAPEDFVLIKNDEIRYYTFLEEEKYVTDYRYSGAVRKNNLQGVLAPDLVVSLMPLLSMEKADLPSSGILVYDYYEI